MLLVGGLDRDRGTDRRLLVPGGRGMTPTTAAPSLLVAVGLLRRRVSASSQQRCWRVAASLWTGTEEASTGPVPVTGPDPNTLGGRVRV